MVCRALRGFFVKEGPYFQKGRMTMRLVQINATCGNGSTGKICAALSEMLTEQEVENYIFCTSYYGEHVLGRSYMNYWDVKLQALRSRILGNYGFNSKSATKRLIAMLEDVRPDVVHLHNLHAHNCNLQMLIAYLKGKKITIFWTFHDCWAFTGYCPYYDMAGCDQWKTGCVKCPRRKKYSWFLDRSRYLYEKKKALLTGMELTIVAPSRWMAEQVKQSFLYKYRVEVIYNGIDLSVFYPRESNILEKLGCRGCNVVLGVAFDWGPRKGLDVFIELSKRLDERYKIVLVGTSKAIEKQLPENVISVRRTYDQELLAQIYSAADVFVNPTREEVQGLTNIEALACGTPVITFDTGGSPECCDESCAVMVPKDDIVALEREIIRVCQEKPYAGHVCAERARRFVTDNRFKLCELLKKSNGYLDSQEK